MWKCHNNLPTLAKSSTGKTEGVQEFKKRFIKLQLHYCGDSQIKIIFSNTVNLYFSDNAHLLKEL